MSKRLIRFGHPVNIVPRRHCSAFTLESVHEFDRKPFGHRLAFFASCRQQNPPKRQRLLTLGTDLHRHLIAGAADTLAANFDHRLDVIDGLFKDLDGLGILILLLDDLQCIIERRLRSGLFAILHHAVNKFRRQPAFENRIGL